MPPADRFAEGVGRLLGGYGLVLKGEPMPVAGSVLNDNYRAETDRGPVFVRFHRAGRKRERIIAEHRVLAWAAERGLPAAGPLTTLEGSTLAYAAERYAAVFPWIEGHPLAAGAITEDGVRALGEVHGRLHAALDGYADPELPDTGTGSAWDTEQSIAELSRVDDLIRYYPAPSAENLRIQEGLRVQLEMLESGLARPASGFAGLRRQPCHGDFHERNVLFGAGGEVAAVVDWEMVGLLPRAYEVVRALSFSGLLDEPLVCAYLEGYRRHAALTADECVQAVEMWWQSLMHDTWRYRMRFIEGEGRVTPFFESSLALLLRFRDVGYRAEVAGRLTAG
jgi:Ser/Thr protein kinase RdoA (MazF antagonist)